jgi:hypothetical protein
VTASLRLPGIEYGRRRRRRRGRLPPAAAATRWRAASRRLSCSLGKLPDSDSGALRRAGLSTREPIMNFRPGVRVTGWPGHRQWPVAGRLRVGLDDVAADDGCNQESRFSDSDPDLWHMVVSRGYIVILYYSPHGSDSAGNPGLFHMNRIPSESSRRIFGTKKQRFAARSSRFAWPAHALCVCFAVY